MSEIKILKDLITNTNEFDAADLCDMLIICPSKSKELGIDWIKKLDTYAKILLNKRKGTEDARELFKNKEMMKLSLFNKNDVELTFDIFKRCVECGLIQNE